MRTISTSASNKAFLPERILVLVVAIFATMQLFMARRFEINWDEFYNLDKTYKLARDEITNPLQTIFVRLFEWVPLVGGNEVDQILSARLLVFIFAAITCTFIYKIARRWYSVKASLVSVIAFLGFSYVFRGIIAFRHDAVAIPVLMVVLWLVSNERLSWKNTVITGILIGFAGMITLKSIFYMPIVGVFLLSYWRESGWSRARFMHGAITFLTALLSFFIIYSWHGSLLPQAQTGAGYVSNASGAMFLDRGIFPEKMVFLRSLLQNPIFWVGIALGYHALRSEMGSGEKQRARNAIRILSFLLPIICIAFYRHTYEYFYIFMLAPASIVIAAAVDRYFKGERARLFYLVGFIYLGMTAFTFAKSMKQGHEYQSQIVEVIHQTFPEPVPYLDFCGMASSFPRLNEVPLFMNTVTFDQWPYLNAGETIMDDLLQERKPAFLIANTSGLDLENSDEHVFVMDLLPDDTEILKRNFQKFWGPIYIPGQRFNFHDTARSHQFEITLDGVYTVLSEAEIQIDGAVKTPNDTVSLTPGTHTISSSSNQPVHLQWGNNIKPPSLPAPQQMVFRGF